MKTNSINSSLQTIDFEKRSAIIQCHVDKNRLWILTKNGEFDYYSKIGNEPSLHISIDKNVTPKKIWANQRGTKFIVETIDFSLYYFQTCDLTADLFYPSRTNSASKSIGMKNFFRIGSLRNGPVSTIFFDDDPKDPRSTKQIFIVVKGGGVLVLSIEILQNKETKELTTIISDFETFPTLFTNLNILDMKIFRIVERQSDNFILKEIKNKADEVKDKDYELIFNSNIDKSFNFLQKFSELYEIITDARNQIFASKELIEQFRNLYNDLNLHQNAENQPEQNEQNQTTTEETTTSQKVSLKKTSSKAKNDNENNDANNSTNNNDNPDLNSTSFLLSKIEKFVKYEENTINNIDMNFNIKFSKNPKSFHPSFNIWFDCIENMEMVKNETDLAIKNTYKSAFLYQQLDHLISNGRLQNIDQIYYSEDDNENGNDNENEDENESSRKTQRKQSTEIIKNGQDENIEDDFEEEEEDKNVDNNSNYDEDLALEFDFEFDFYFDEKKKKKKKAKDNRKGKKKENSKKNSDNEVLNSIKSQIFQIIDDIKEFLNEQTINKTGKLTELRKMISIKLKRIKEINESITLLKKKMKTIFQKKHQKKLKFFEDYMLDRKKHFPQNEGDNHLTMHFINKANKHINNILDMLKQQASFNVNFIESIEMFCKFAKPFFEDSNAENVDDFKYSIIRNYLIFLAEDRIIRSWSSKSPIEILQKMVTKPYYQKKFNEMKINISKIDIHSRLVHKPLKVSPSHKRPTFYFVTWDSEKSINVCYSFKFKKNQTKKKKSYKRKEENENIYEFEIPYKKESKQKEKMIIKQVKKFEFEPEMRLIFYQITPSGLVVVQNSERSDSKAVAYEVSSLILNETNVSSTRGKLLWSEEITDYSLLPILNCDFCPETGLIIYNSMQIKLISRENVDLQSFNRLVGINDPQTIKKVRKYLALTPEQKNETFFILLVYAMNQLFERENDFQSKKRIAKMNPNKDNQTDSNEVDFHLLFKLIFAAREALMKLLNTATCTKMSIFLFLMDDKKLNEKINFCLTPEKNDGRLFERFRRFRIEFLVNMLDSLNGQMKRQQEALLIMALDLLMQCYSTRNNKNIYIDDATPSNSRKIKNDESNANDNNDSEYDNDDDDDSNDDEVPAASSANEDDASMNLYFKKCFTDKIDVDDITSLTKKYGSSLISINCAYYILKSFPVLDSASFFKSESESEAEITFSKVYKFLAKSSESTFLEAWKVLVNYLNIYQDGLKRYKNQMTDQKTITMLTKNSKEIDYMIGRLLLYGFEKHNRQDWFFSSFCNFFNDLENLTILPKIPCTILSLFNFVKHQRPEANYEPFAQFDPVINYMKSYYEKENNKDQIDLLFSIFVSIEKLKEMEALRKKKDYNTALAIYRSSRLRVHAAKLLEDFKMTSVAIDVVLDEKSPSTAIKFASSLKDDNTMLYLVRTASRRKESLFNSIYHNVVDTKRNSATNEKLYDVLMCIPHDKLNGMESLLENIFKTLEEIDNESNEELKKIKALQEKMKPISDVRDKNFVISSPFNSCDFCHNTVLNKDFVLFPCGHVFHNECYKERSRRDQIDREKMEVFHPNSQKFTTNANQCLCPMCGLGAVELIDTPMYALLDEEDVHALAKNTGYIDEYVSDDDDDFSD